MRGIPFTSGTTGKSKGVMIIHGNIPCVVYESKNEVEIRGRGMQVIPMHHTYVSVSLLTLLVQGYDMVMNKSIKRLSKDLVSYKPYVVPLVPLVVETLYNKTWSNVEKNNKTKRLQRLLKISNIF